MPANFHEDLGRSPTIRSASERQFGLVFAAVFFIVGVAPLRSGGQVRFTALALAAASLAAGVLRPSWLRVPNKLWAQLGVLLGRLVNPFVTGVLFYLVFTPAALVSRLMGRDPLRIRPDPGAPTYWITRQPPGPDPRTMSKQF